jgi:hypothetical protein
VFIRVQDYQASKEGDERPGNKGRQYRTMKRSRDVAPIAIRHEKISSTKRVISGVERNSLQICMLSVIKGLTVLFTGLFV